MYRWFMTRVALVAQLDERAAIIARRDETIRDKDAQIAALVREMDAGWARAHNETISKNDQIRRQAQTIKTQSDEIARLLSAHEAKNAQLVEELRSLRDDIARREQAETEARAYMPVRGFGMARDVAAPRRRTEPMPWQVRDAIDQDAAHVRLDDGAGEQ